MVRDFLASIGIGPNKNFSEDARFRIINVLDENLLVNTKLPNKERMMMKDSEKIFDKSIFWTPAGTVVVDLDNNFVSEPAHIICKRVENGLVQIAKDSSYYLLDSDFNLLIAVDNVREFLKCNDKDNLLVRYANKHKKTFYFMISRNHTVIKFPSNVSVFEIVTVLLPNVVFTTYEREIYVYNYETDKLTNLGTCYNHKITGNVLIIRDKDNASHIFRTTDFKVIAKDIAYIDLHESDNIMVISFIDKQAPKLLLDSKTLKKTKLVKEYGIPPINVYSQGRNSFVKHERMIRKVTGKYIKKIDIHMLQFYNIRTNRSTILKIAQSADEDKTWQIEGAYVHLVKKIFSEQIKYL